MYSRAARLVREQKGRDGSVADEKELVGRGEEGSNVCSRGGEEKPSEKRDGKGGSSGRTGSASSFG